jgi:hypothetical protein
MYAWSHSNRAASDEFRAVDGSRERGQQKRDQLGDFFRLAGMAERDAAQGGDELLPCFVFRAFAVRRHALDEGLRGAGFDETRCDAVHAHAVRTELLGQRFAVVGQRGLGGGVGDGRLEQGQAPLDRRDVDDGAGTAFAHGRQEGTVEPHRRHQVGLDRRIPHRIGERERAAARRGRTAHVVDEEIQMPEFLPHDVGHQRRPFGRGHVRREITDRGQGRLRQAARRRDHRGALLHQPADDGGAHALGAARDEGLLAGEAVAAHTPISSDSMAPAWSRKRKCRMTGLPGKLPRTRARKLCRPSVSSRPAGSIMDW